MILRHLRFLFYYSEQVRLKVGHRKVLLYFMFPSSGRGPRGSRRRRRTRAPTSLPRPLRRVSALATGTLFFLVQPRAFASVPASSTLRETPFLAHSALPSCIPHPAPSHSRSSWTPFLQLPISGPSQSGSSSPPHRGLILLFPNYQIPRTIFHW